VELNSSFLSLAAAGDVPGLAEPAPNAFQFSVKAPRGLTHAKKLYAPERGSSKSPGAGTSWVTGAPCLWCSSRAATLETMRGSDTPRAATP